MTGNAYAEIDSLCATLSLRDGAHTAAEMILFRHDIRTNPLKPVCDIQETALLQLVKSGNFDARQKLVTGNLRTVLKANRGYARNGTRIFDLLKAGNRGLIHAQENYAPENDGDFAEYAGQCIRQHIEQALYPDRARKQDGHPGHLPTSLFAMQQCA